MHSAVVLSATLKEREAQMAMSRRKREMEAEAEAMHVEMIRAEHTRALQRELDEQALQKQMNAEQRRINQEQYAYVADRKRVERHEELREAEVMRQAVMATNAEVEEQRLKRLELQRKSAKDNAAALHLQHQAKLERARLDYLEEQKFENEARERENLELRRKEFEKERQEQRNRTLEAQGKKLEAISVAQHAREGERIARDQAAIQEKKDIEERAQLEKKKVLQEEVIQQRSLQVARKRVTREKEEAEAAKLNVAWKSAIARLEWEEKEVMRLEREKVTAIRLENQRQIVAKRQKEYAEAELELRQYAEYRNRLAEDTSTYEEWVDRQLQEAREKQRNLIPMYKTLDQQRVREKGMALLSTLPKNREWGIRSEGDKVLSASSKGTPAPKKH